VKSASLLSISDPWIYPTGLARKQKLVDDVIAEASHQSQSSPLEINGLRDNQTLLLGDSGLAIRSSERIPEKLDIQL
jgi:hypothetical protein